MKMAKVDASSVTIRRCSPEEYEEMLRFLNDCFDKPSERWFEEFYGHIFQPDRAYVERTFLVRCGKRLVGAIGIYPMTLRIGTATITVGGIGSVATHKSVRGRGIMSVMLRRMLEVMREEDYDVSWLGGDRFRYRNYGWDFGGRRMFLHIRQKDLVRYYPQLPAVRLVRGADAGDAIARKLYSKFPVAAVRSRRTWLDLRRRKNHIRSVCESSRGNAYLYYYGDNLDILAEIQGEPKTALALVARHMARHNLQRVLVDYPCIGDALGGELLHVAADFQILHKAQIQVVDIQSTWKKLLPEVKSRYATMPRLCAALDSIKSDADRTAILGRLLGFCDNLPALSPRLKAFEDLRPLGWWLSDCDCV